MTTKCGRKTTAALQHQRGNTLLAVPSSMRFSQQEFGEFPRLVGRYCSYLPHDGTPKSVWFRHVTSLPWKRAHQVQRNGQAEYKTSSPSQRTNFTETGYICSQIWQTTPVIHCLLIIMLDKFICTMYGSTVQ